MVRQGAAGFDVRVSQALKSGVCGLVLAIMATGPAIADDGLQTNGRTGDVKISSKRGHHAGGRTKKPSSRSTDNNSQRLRENQRQADKYFDYLNRKQTYEACRSTGQSGCAAPGNAVVLPDPIARAHLIAA